MKDSDETLQEHDQRRRDFVIKSAKIAAAAPAVTLLLSQASLAQAQALSGVTVTGTPPPTQT